MKNNIMLANMYRELKEEEEENDRLTKKVEELESELIVWKKLYSDVVEEKIQIKRENTDLTLGWERLYKVNSALKGGA